jgi:hypothetical protein
MGNCVNIDIDELDYDVVPQNIIKEWDVIKLGGYKGKYVLILDDKEMFIINNITYIKDKELYIKSNKSTYNKFKIDNHPFCYDFNEFHLEIKKDYYSAKLTKYEIDSARNLKFDCNSINTNHGHLNKLNLGIFDIRNNTIDN